MRIGLGLALALLVGATPIAAEPTYAPYATAIDVSEGGAGAKIDRGGIAYWIAGLPAGRFEVLGTISDGKRYRLLTKDPVGSRDISRLARQAGGNAVIVINDPIDASNAEAVLEALMARKESFSLSADDGRDSTPTTFIVINHIGFPNG